MRRPRTVDEYLTSVPEPGQSRLKKLRAVIRAALPQEATETINFGIPAFKWKGMLVWYAAFKKHIGFYPRRSAISAFKLELAGYKTSKGAIQFPIEKPIPETLVKKIVAFRVKENSRASEKP